MKEIEKALEACERGLEGIEDETITTTSALLQCLKVARLTDDTESLIWLQYECNGYPVTNGGIEHNAWIVGYKNGRSRLNDNGEEAIFTELASELEAKIQSEKSAINNFSTSGASVSGEYASVAIKRLTSSVDTSTKQLLKRIADNERKLAILKATYYDYALRKSIELTFSNVASDIFAVYRQEVDNYFSELSTETILKLKAIEDKIDSDNPEMYSQALTTCRRLFESCANELFAKYFPNYSEQFYKTKSGKEIDISGDHYRNRLSAVVEYLQDKSSRRTLVGSNIEYLLDWIENINNLQCKGVHANITRDDAVKCIIHTYICLGDVLSMQVSE